MQQLNYLLGQCAILLPSATAKGSIFLLHRRQLSSAAAVCAVSKWYQQQLLACNGHVDYHTSGAMSQAEHVANIHLCQVTACATSIRQT